MYAIIFDFNIETLNLSYHNSLHGVALGNIRKVLIEEYGFNWKQGNVYFGSDSVDAVTCTLAVQDLTYRFDWFSQSVCDVRMLRIEDNNDLMPIVKKKQDMPSVKKTSL